MSHLRPEIRTVYGAGSAIPNGTAYLMIFNAVQTKDGLIHGKLRDSGESCAIGSFYDVNPNAVLFTNLIDEVAAVNDSAPKMTPKQRKQMMLRWLRWRLNQIGMPGFAQYKENPVAT